MGVGGCLSIVLVLGVLIGVGGENSFMKNAKISTRIVQTRYGRLQGLLVPMDQHKYLKPVEIFLGVPYATPPVQSNRFSPTRTPSPWDGVRLADKMSPVCPQKLPNISNETAALEKMPKGRLEYLKRLLPLLKNQSEDCLYLNVFSPAKVFSICNTWSCDFPYTCGEDFNYCRDSCSYHEGLISCEQENEIGCYCPRGTCARDSDNECVPI